MEHFKELEGFEKGLLNNSYFWKPKIILRFQNSLSTKSSFIKEDAGGASISKTKYGAHRYTHIFYKLNNDDKNSSSSSLQMWKYFYARLYICNSNYQLFNFSAHHFYKYNGYNAKVFKDDYLKSQMYQDRFSVKQSDELLIECFLQGFPNCSIDKWPPYIRYILNISRNSSETTNSQKILFSAISGWGGNCPFGVGLPNKVLDILKDLTKEYNANKMLICEAVFQLNISAYPDYAFEHYLERDYRYFQIRDDTLFKFPPDSNAVYYSSPGYTFIVLKEPPIVFGNIFKPFRLEVWLLVTAFVVITYTIWIFYREAYKGKRWWTHILKFTIGMFYILVTTCYGGMILVGILMPVYPWSPSTFQELNRTKRFIGATSFYEGINPRDLIDQSLIGIKVWRDREIERENRTTPGSYLEDDENDLNHRYAMFMYEDKKHLFVYGRTELKYTAKYLHRIKTDTDSIHPETRYYSIYCGSSLQFLMNGIRKTFEAGSWLRWRGLENNYYKLVAPILVQRYRTGNDSYSTDAELSSRRPLKSSDIITHLCIWSIGLIGSGLILGLEHLVSICFLGK